MANENLPKKILVVDDDPSIGNTMKSSLASYGINVLSASDLDTALYMFNQNLFDVLVIEQEFGALPGLVLVQKWRKHQDETRAATGIVLATGNRNFSHASAEAALVRELGATEQIIKPFTVPQLLTVLARAYALSRRLGVIKEVRGVVQKLAARPETFEKTVMMAKSKLNELGHDALFMLLDLYRQTGRHAEALTAVDGFLEKDPNNLRLLNAKSRILLQMGDFTKSLGIMEQIDRIAPQNIERIDAMAEAYLKLDQPDKSVNKMRELIKLNPDEPNMKFSMFERLSEHGFTSHAMDLCRETTNPMEVVRFYNNKGVALSKAGRVDGAITEYERSLQFYPTFKENYRIFYNVALAYISKKTRDAYELALVNVERSLGLNPAFEKAQNTKAMLEKILRSAARDAAKGVDAKDGAAATKAVDAKAPAPAVTAKAGEGKTAIAPAAKPGDAKGAADGGTPKTSSVKPGAAPTPAAKAVDAKAPGADVKTDARVESAHEGGDAVQAADEEAPAGLGKLPKPA